MNIPEHAGLKKVAFLSIGMVSKVEGESIGLARKAIQFFPNELFGQPNTILLRILFIFLRTETVRQLTLASYG